MHVIPVIDIKGGVVVHARAGARASYRPIDTPLANSADPLDVMRGLLALYPFESLYVADLDGIERGDVDHATQQRILDAWPGRRVLIDDGRPGLRPQSQSGRRVDVFGSETITSAEQLAAAQVLSLDFRGEQFVGPAALLDNAAAWPREVIVMTLANVGMGGGPDIRRVRDVIARADGRAVYAAGGVRHLDDLKALREAGAYGALVATALHNGQIKTRDLEEIAGESF